MKLSISLQFGQSGRLLRSVSAALAAQGMRYCAKCSSVKQTNEFYGTFSWCKDCQSEYSKTRKRYQSNGKAIRWATKAELVDLMGGYCVRCGFDEFQSSFDFHHIDPAQKQFEIGYYLSSRKTKLTDELMAEADKCALLCRNCHHALESGEWAADWMKREGCGWTIEAEDTL